MDGIHFDVVDVSVVLVSKWARGHVAEIKVNPAHESETVVRLQGPTWFVVALGAFERHNRIRSRIAVGPPRQNTGPVAAEAGPRDEYTI